MPLSVTDLISGKPLPRDWQTALANQLGKPIISAYLRSTRELESYLEDLLSRIFIRDDAVLNFRSGPDAVSALIDLAPLYLAGTHGVAKSKATAALCYALAIFLEQYLIRYRDGASQKTVECITRLSASPFSYGIDKARLSHLRVVGLPLRDHTETVREVKHRWDTNPDCRCLWNKEEALSPRNIATSHLTVIPAIATLLGLRPRRVDGFFSFSSDWHGEESLDTYLQRLVGRLELVLSIRDSELDGLRPYLPFLKSELAYQQKQTRAAQFRNYVQAHARKLRGMGEPVSSIEANELAKRLDTPLSFRDLTRLGQGISLFWGDERTRARLLAEIPELGRMIEEYRTREFAAKSDEMFARIRALGERFHRVKLSVRQKFARLTAAHRSGEFLTEFLKLQKEYLMDLPILEHREIAAELESTQLIPKRTQEEDLIREGWYLERFEEIAGDFRRLDMEVNLPRLALSAHLRDSAKEAQISRDAFMETIAGYNPSEKTPIGILVSNFRMAADNSLRESYQETVRLLQVKQVELVAWRNALQGLLEKRVEDRPEHISDADIREIQENVAMTISTSVPGSLRVVRTEVHGLQDVCSRLQAYTSTSDDNSCFIALKQVYQRWLTIFVKSSKNDFYSAGIDCDDRREASSLEERFREYTEQLCRYEVFERKLSLLTERYNVGESPDTTIVRELNRSNMDSCKRADGYSLAALAKAAVSYLNLCSQVRSRSDVSQVIHSDMPQNLDEIGKTVSAVRAWLKSAKKRSLRLNDDAMSSFEQLLQTHVLSVPQSERRVPRMVEESLAGGVPPAAGVARVLGDEGVRARKSPAPNGGAGAGAGSGGKPRAVKEEPHEASPLVDRSKQRSNGLHQQSLTPFVKWCNEHIREPGMQLTVRGCFGGTMYTNSFGVRQRKIPATLHALLTTCDLNSLSDASKKYLLLKELNARINRGRGCFSFTDTETFNFYLTLRDQLEALNVEGYVELRDAERAKNLSEAAARSGKSTASKDAVAAAAPPRVEEWASGATATRRRRKHK